MNLADGEEPTEEGILEPLLDAGEDPPPTTLGVVDKILSARTASRKRCWGRRRRRLAISCWSRWIPTDGCRRNLIWTRACQTRLNSVANGAALPFR
eukprot:5652284-Pleurochrysis_carterae.AAC.1